MLTYYGREVAVKPGAYVVPDGWRGFGGRLEAGDSFSTYRLPTTSLGPIKSLAAEVKITGRSVQRFQGNNCVRVQITFPGDGEPDTVTHGWMKLEV